MPVWNVLWKLSHLTEKTLPFSKSVTVHYICKLYKKIILLFTEVFGYYDG